MYDSGPVTIVESLVLINKLSSYIHLFWKKCHCSCLQNVSKENDFKIMRYAFPVIISNYCTLQALMHLLFVSFVRSFFMCTSLLQEYTVLKISHRLNVSILDDDLCLEASGYCIKTPDSCYHLPSHTSFKLQPSMVLSQISCFY